MLRIYILGHSIAKTDFEYFRKIHDIVPTDCMWSITYLSKNDKKNIDYLVKKIGIKNIDICKMEKYYI